MSPRGSLGAWSVAGVLALALRSTEPAGPAEPDMAAPRPVVVTASPAPARPEPPLVLDWGGCAYVLEGTPLRCVLGKDRTLQLWVSHPRASEVEVLVDGLPIGRKTYVRDEVIGLGLRVRAPVPARVLEVRVPGAPGAPALLGLRNLDDFEEDARAMLSKLDEAATSIEPLIDRGEHEAACARASGAIAIARREGLRSEALRVLTITTHQLQKHDAVDEALALLDEHRELCDGFPRARAEWHANRAPLLWRAGRLHEAAESYREAVRHAIRTDYTALANDTLSMYGELLVELGYFGAAQHWMHQVLPLARQELDDCELGSVLRTTAWAALGLEREGLPHDDATALYREALAIFGPRGTCPRPHKLPGIRLGLAEAELLRGRPEAALRQLDTHDPTRVKVSQIEEVWLAELELRVRLTRGEGDDALQRALQTLEAAAREAATPDARWRAATRRGDVRTAEGAPQAAIAAYSEAEDAADELAHLAVFGVSLATTAAERRASIEGLVAALVGEGRHDEAICAARRAQARAAQTVAREPGASAGYLRAKGEYEGLLEGAAFEPVKRRDRTLRQAAQQREALETELQALLQRSRSAAPPRCDELTSREPGELLVAILPVQGRWLVLAQDDEGTLAHAVEHLDTLVHSLPFEDRLPQAHRVRVLAQGQARELDVHRVSWSGAPLATRVPVVYGAEVLPHPRAEPASRHAVLLADPLQTLPGAKASIDDAAQVLADAGWPVERLPPALATPAAVREALASAWLFGFAGHADYPDDVDSGLWPPYAGGHAGRSAHLVLAESGRLEPHDVLLLPTTPALAILDACRAGPSVTRHGGISLVEALLARGTRAVLAAPHDLDDRSATVLAERVYAHLARNPDLPLAFSRAYAALWHEGPSAALTQAARFRVWVP